MIFKLNNKQIVGSFELNGIKYPSNWLQLATPSQLVALGITTEPDQVFTPSVAELEETIRQALQGTIDAKAVSLGFSSGNALMLYAGFVNQFQSLANVFATWEANIWAKAAAYKDEVAAGTKPMLTPEEAVALIPAY